MGQREILKMIENISSKIDSLSGRTPETTLPQMQTISVWKTWPHRLGQQG